MEKTVNIEEEIFVILFKHCPPLLEVQAREMAKKIADIVKRNAPETERSEK